MADNLLLTQEAYDRLKDELERLITVDRIEIAKKIQDSMKNIYPNAAILILSIDEEADR